jgi:single-strand DNA-binding protein
MGSLNRVILVGNLGGDAELKVLESDNAVASFNLATSERWTDKISGDRKEKTDWHRIVVWGKQATALAEYLVKGKQVLVEGSLATRSYDDKHGERKYVTEVKARSIVLLGSRTDEGETPRDPVVTADDIPF